jgi:ATP-binding cassette subfamily B protein
MLVLALNRWLVARARVVRARAAAADIFEFLDRRAEAGQAIDVEFLQPLAKRLDFSEVSLREPGTGRMVLENVSLSIPAGSKAAVVYAEAAEAHALAYLIVRFLDPTAGEVKIDGKNVRWVTFDSLRTQAAIVLEQSLTFTDTVANNIGCGDPSFSLPQIIEAAKLAHAHQFVQHLAHGYETPIGEGGASLKLGERFRIALARAILRDPSLIVIEEPSEGVDPDSLALIDDAITRVQAGRTILFLARRPSTVRSADRVFVLQNGKLAASGRHEELLAGSEIYRLMHFKQALTASSAV